MKILIKTKNVPSIENKAFERTLDFRIFENVQVFLRNELKKMFQNAVIQCLTQWHVLQSLCVLVKGVVFQYIYN